MVASTLAWRACNLTGDRVDGIETLAPMTSIEFDKSGICVCACINTKDISHNDFHSNFVSFISLVPRAAMYMSHAGEKARILRQ